MIFWTVKYTNTQIQIRKYTNTACEKVPEIPNILIFLKSQRYQDIKNDILDCQIYKYKDTNAQIHCDEVPEIPNMYIFSKSQGSKDIKNDILDCQKYKYTRDAITTCHQI